MDEIMVIGIAGGTGSGKTTITKKLMQHFGGDVSVIYHDNYYKAHHNMSYEERSRLNYDHPDSFDTDLLIQAVKDLKAGRSVTCPVYDYTIHDRSDKVIVVKPAKVIIVEGILIFENEELRDLMDIKIFVDTDADIRLCRRIKRDVNKRGRSLESVLMQYQQTVKPMHERYVEPSKKYADLVVPEGGKNLVALSMITGHIRHYLDEEQPWDTKA